MNDDADRDGDDFAERLLLDTIVSLRRLASASLKDPSLSMWGQGRVLHGDMLIARHAGPLIELIHAVSAQAESPEITQSLLGTINLLLIGSFQIGQGSDQPLDQEKYENDQRTQPAREARRKKSGKGDRLNIAHNIFKEVKEQHLSTNVLLKRVNDALKREGLGGISTKTLLRYKEEWENEILDDNGHTDIVSAFLRTD